MLPDQAFEAFATFLAFDKEASGDSGNAVSSFSAPAGLMPVATQLPSHCCTHVTISSLLQTWPAGEGRPAAVAASLEQESVQVLWQPKDPALESSISAQSIPLKPFMQRQRPTVLSQRPLQSVKFDFAPVAVTFGSQLQSPGHLIREQYLPSYPVKQEHSPCLHRPRSEQLKAQAPPAVGTREGVELGHSHWPQHYERSLTYG